MPVVVVVVGGGRRRGGKGRKLHAEGGRVETVVKISEIRRCWRVVSYEEKELAEDLKRGKRYRDVFTSWV